MTRQLTTAEVATQLQTTRQNVIVLVTRHPHLRPATQLPAGDYLWTAEEIAAVATHRATHKRGRPSK
jgi:hypothetical protein